MTPHDTPTRRRFLGSLASGAGAAIIGHGVLASGVLRAATPPVDGAASATEQAVRLQFENTESDDLDPDDPAPDEPDPDPPDPADPADPQLGDPLTFPVLTGDGLITLNNFGGRSVSTGACSHLGIDVFPTTSATRVLVACVDGVIEGQRVLSGSQGNAWILQDAAGVSYRYHHIGEFESGLEVGSVIRRGDVLGTMGSTGNAGSPHLHFEVRVDGTSSTAVDPVPLLPFPIDGVNLGEPTGCS